MEFKPLDINEVKEVLPFLESHPFRSCDYTVGGLYLWADAFDYKACVKDGTLYVSGHPVNRQDVEAFSIPLGPKPLDESLEPLREYCERVGKPLILSSVPEEALPVLIDMGAKRVEQLSDWSDYMYSAESLATFSGKKLAKKRNHVNRFEADHPDAEFRKIVPEDVEALKAFYERITSGSDKDSPMAEYDRKMTVKMLEDMEKYPFEGCVLITKEKGIAGFTFGEVIGDTLHVHIEKMDHEIAGAGETLCHRFVAYIMKEHPEVSLVNRQDDSGDMGLRRAKLSLHPMFMVHKYNVEF